MAQGDFSVNAPQVVQNWMRSRAVTMASARCFTMPDSACTMCNATRSAERGPMPGSLASAAISVVMELGSMAANAKLKIKN